MIPAGTQEDTMAGLDQTNALSRALDDFFQRPPLAACPAEAELYKVEHAFGSKPYWQDSVRSERFEKTLNRGILYRPQIVNEMCAKIVTCLKQRVRSGIMVKGPQGIGKSHSLVNMVCKLQSSGDYLVTFLPDCNSWNNGKFLLEQICASFGSTLQDLGIAAVTEDILWVAIEQIDAQLSRLEKKWVFVFDQINKLFVKPMNRHAKDAFPVLHSLSYDRSSFKARANHLCYHGLSQQ
jgi:Cdc6-like AAA superfamily ATPase